MNVFVTMLGVMRAIYKSVTRICLKMNIPLGIFRPLRRLSRMISCLFYQYRMQGMMTYDPAHNPRKRQAPELRPDYVILQQSKVVTILDAKYRDLWENALPPHMLYQLAVYALSQPEGVDAIILYPTVQSEAKEARIMLRDPIYGTGRAYIVLRPVNLLHLEQLVTSPK